MQKQHGRMFGDSMAAVGSYVRFSGISTTDRISSRVSASNHAEENLGIFMAWHKEWTEAGNTPMLVYTRLLFNRLTTGDKGD